MVGNEANGRHYHPILASRVELADAIADVRFEPGLRRGAAAALEDELPVCHAGRGRHEPARFSELRDIAAGIGHRDRNAVCREQDRRGGAFVDRKLRQASGEVVRHRPNKSRVIEEHPELVDLRGPVTQRGQRRGNVFAVLAAAGIAAVGTGDKCRHASNARVCHFAERVGEERVPVPIAPVNGESGAAVSEFLPEGLEQGEILPVDRTASTEVVIVFRHLQHPLPGDIPAAEDVFQERHHVIGAIGAAERNQKNRVVEACHGCGSRDWSRPWSPKCQKR